MTRRAAGGALGWQESKTSWWKPAGGKKKKKKKETVCDIEEKPPTLFMWNPPRKRKGRLCDRQRIPVFPFVWQRTAHRWRQSDRLTAWGYNRQMDAGRDDEMR